MGTHHPIRKTVAPEPTVIPDKLYFRIGDVATLLDVPAYVLRFWETEFPQLKPNKGGTGQRLYRKKDVEMALRIKSLLYDQGYTIPGARQVFKSEAKSGAEIPEAVAAPRETPAAVEAVRPQLTGHQTAQLHTLRAEMMALLADLSAPIGTQPVASIETPAPLRSKVKPMRPKFAVLETKPEPTAKLNKLKLHQRDLFGFDAPDGDPPRSA